MSWVLTIVIYTHVFVVVGSRVDCGHRCDSKLKCVNVCGVQSAYF